MCSFESMRWANTIVNHRKLTAATAAASSPPGVPMYLSRLFLSLLEAILPSASAHCDTADGPAVTDGRRALETGNVSYALKWIQADGETELTEVFNKALAVRKLGLQAAEVADRLFLETLVRL